MEETGNQSIITLTEGVHVLVKNKEGLVEQNETGNWLILDLQTQNMFYVSPTIEVLHFFKIGEWASVSHKESAVTENNFEENIQETGTGQENNDGRNPWSKPDILKLVDYYKNYETYFKSTTTKNDKVWQWISKDIKTHTPEQCKNKFRYLKAKYVEKKDNMGTRATGSKAFNFEYFEEFESIFGNDANVKPVAVASSSRGDSNITEEFDRENASFEDNPKKRKKSFLEKQLSAYEETMRERENARQKRHKEQLDRQDQALEISSYFF